MNTQDTAIIIILGETSAILACIVLALLIALWIKKRRYIKRLSQLISSITDGEEMRRNELSTSFAAIPGIQKTHLDKIVEEIITQERLFYGAISDAFVKNDIRYFEKLDSELAKVTAPYLKLASVDTETSVRSENSQDSNSIIAENNDDIDRTSLDIDSDQENDPQFDLSASDMHPDKDDDDLSQGIKIAEIPEELLGTDENHNPGSGDNLDSSDPIIDRED
jgi:hypothetical protein